MKKYYLYCDVLHPADSSGFYFISDNPRHDGVYRRLIRVFEAQNYVEALKVCSEHGKHLPIEK